MVMLGIVTWSFASGFGCIVNAFHIVGLGLLVVWLSTLEAISVF